MTKKAKSYYLSNEFYQNLFHPYKKNHFEEDNCNFSYATGRMEIATEKKTSVHTRDKEKSKFNPFDMFYDLSKFRTEYNPAWLKNDICEQFLGLGENAGRKDKSTIEIDLNLMKKLLSKNFNEVTVKYLMVFNLEAIQSALYKATFEEDTDLKAEINYVKDEIGDINIGMTKLSKKLNEISKTINLVVHANFPNISEQQLQNPPSLRNSSVLNKKH